MEVLTPCRCGNLIISSSSLNFEISGFSCCLLNSSCSTLLASATIFCIPPIAFCIPQFCILCQACILCLLYSCALAAFFLAELFASPRAACRPQPAPAATTKSPESGTWELSKTLNLALSVQTYFWSCCLQPSLGISHSTDNVFFLTFFKTPLTPPFLLNIW